MVLQKVHNEVALLTHLLTHQEHAFSVRELAKQLDINYRTAHDAITRLEEEGAITNTRLGNRNAVTLSGALTPAVYAAEHHRTTQALKNKKIATAKKQLTPPTTQYCMVLFGSHAKHAANKRSDIDICVIADEKTQEDIKKRARRSALPIQLHAFTEEQYTDMRTRTTDNITHHIKNHHVILHGAEHFYELTYGPTKHQTS